MKATTKVSNLINAFTPPPPSPDPKPFQYEKREREKEAEERHESMMAQWKMWQMRLSQQHEFDDLMHKFAEMKHAYMYHVTMEVLKFCRCTDFTQELGRYFMHEVKTEG